MNFLEALADPSFGFLRNALAAGLRASVLCGVRGAVVTV